MSKSIFEKLINMIKIKHVEVGNYNIEPIPSIYYIGLGKTGSASIKMGFPKNTVAHWHTTSYFENIYKTSLLTDNKLDLYDLIFYIGEKYKFKPLIIECTREPIGQYLSAAFHILRLENSNYNQDLNKWKNEKNYTFDSLISIFNKQLKLKEALVPYSCILWKKHFNYDLCELFNPDDKYLFIENDKVKLLFLRYIDINKRDEIFKKLGYHFINMQNNSTNKLTNFKKIYDNLKNNLNLLNLERNDLERLYYNIYTKTFYTNSEIESFINKYIKK